MTLNREYNGRTAKTLEKSSVLRFVATVVQPSSIYLASLGLCDTVQDAG